MNASDIRNMIEEGEGTQVEFKRRISSPEKIARALIAFANTKGGKVLFGVDDDGSIIGVESEKTEVDLINTAGGQYCEPPIYPEVEIIPFNNRDVVVALVKESDNKPHYFVNGDEEKEKVFIRVKDKTVLASREVVRVLRDERPDRPPLRITIGSNERRLFEYLELNERVTVEEYAQLINVSKRRASRILTTLVRAGVIRIHTLEKRDYFTLAFG